MRRRVGSILVAALLAWGANLARAHAGSDTEEPGQPRPRVRPPLLLPEAGPWRVGLAATAARSTDLFDDGFYEDGPLFDAGIQAEYVLPFALGLRVGIGARYSYGAGRPSSDNHSENEHIACALALLGWGFRSPQTGDELEVLAGAGPARVALSYGAPNGGHLWAEGTAGELGVNFIHPFAANRRYALVVGISVRHLLVKVRGGALGHHDEAPIHVGIRF
jgi:hypothetical protein